MTMREVQPDQLTMPSGKPFSWRFCIIQIVLIAILVGLATPYVIEQKKMADQTRATGNLRQISLVLYEFENDFGSYPSEATAQLVTRQHPKHGHVLSGRSSNALFRQLFAARYVTECESFFYAKIPGVRKPDGDTSPGKLLEKGEVGFAYVAGLTSEGNSSRPIAFTPMIPGTKKIDPEPFEGRAVFLRTDGSVSSLIIGKDGHCRIGGIDILSSENPIWDGKATDIRYPDL